MCGDPDRAPGEWHSEDYSEPFSFQPPESYPLCKPCHGRLHKRFNAPAGEWELFCLHLESGGYGSEFVKRLTLAERRDLSQHLASGEAVSLARVRPCSPGPHWWQTLTLDPESLEAPWARPRPLRERPAAEDYATAMLAIGLSDTEAAILRLHAAADRRTLSMRAIAKGVLGTDKPYAANLAYGRLAARLTEALGWAPDRRADGTPVWMSAVAEGWYPPRREYEWTMVPPLAEAVVNGDATAERSTP
ncbi:MAG: hypothetical protein KAY22_11895 [Rhizorhabdus sp.]|uniref:hypothetical protein n=1 Tax=Rhizorhabdus sp. TaxID=1968843 RepID=UPI001B443FE5|nr:hypothetical protein [Rhizorhabdus sp.]MBP8232999.1 hypothetical protein [Rhizorhabdus sp.]